MTLTDAQRRARNKYERTLNFWNLKLKDDDFDKIESARHKTGLSRRELLLKAAELIEENPKLWEKEKEK